MQTKFAVLVAVAALVMGGNIRADVVGLQTNTNQISSVPGGFDISGGDTLLYFEFGTTGLSGAKFTGISFNNLGANNIDFIAELREYNLFYNEYFPVAASLGKYTAAGSKIDFSKIPNSSAEELSRYGLNAGTNYALSLYSLSQVLIDNYESSNGVITNSMTDWIAGPTLNSTTGLVTMVGPAFTLYSSVPEPGTMILTGTALAAGAVGAYFKRRRKPKREPAA
jgi:hypothetical protein